MSQAGILDVESSNPQIPTSFVTDLGTAIPILNELELLGSNGVTTSASGKTITVAGINATAGATALLATKGVASFDSAAFTVTAGFVELTTIPGALDTLQSDDGAPAVEPDGTGLIQITGSNGIITSGQGPGNILTVAGINASLIQRGVIQLATDADAIFGAATDTAIVPSSLKAKLGTQTDHGVLVGSGDTSAITALTVGTTGQLLVGATGADPAFGSIAYGDFSFSNLTAATPRTLAVSNTDTNAASTSDLRLSVPSLGADAMVSWEVQGTLFYSAGVDNSVAGDPWVLSNSSDPSSGNALISTTSAGVITLFNDLDVTEGGTGVSTLTSHGVLMGNGAGDIQATAEPANGQLLIGKTGDFPQLATLTDGTGITITEGAGTITIDAKGGGLSWTTKSGNDNFVSNNGYIAIAPGGALVFTLPSVSSVGAVIGITLAGATSFGIAQAASQTVRVGSQVTAAGAGTKVVSTAQGDTLLLLCIVAGTGTGDGNWIAISCIGNFTITT